MKKIRTGCGRCGSEDIDITTKAINTSIETRYKCLKCGFEWSEYNNRQ